MKKQITKKSLFREYISHWYVILINILFLFPAYMILPFALSFFITNGISVFCSSILAICISGFVGTLPMFVLNLKLAAKKKFYALAVQFVLFDLTGTIFFVINRVLMNS